MTLGSMCDAWRSLFWKSSLECQVWHFIYLATGAVAVSTPKSLDDSSVLLGNRFAAPPGHGNYFDELSDLAEAGKPDPEALAELPAKYDTVQLATLRLTDRPASS